MAICQKILVVRVSNFYPRIGKCLKSAPLLCWVFWWHFRQNRARFRPKHAKKGQKWPKKSLKSRGSQGGFRLLFDSFLKKWPYVKKYWSYESQNLSTNRKVFKECLPASLGVLVTFSAKSGSFSAETWVKKAKIQGLQGDFRLFFDSFLIKWSFLKKYWS